MLTADCNTGCGCNANAMAPVCSQDGMANFFSPCLAGCQSFSTVNGTTVSPGPALRRGASAGREGWLYVKRL